MFEMKSIAHAILTAVFVATTGCFPIPHTTERQTEIHGRIIDSATSLPVQHAKICFLQEPQHITYSDENGFFHVHATRNFHWAYTTDGAGWPGRKDTNMGISKTNYETLTGTWSGEVGDIYLKPVK